MRFRVIGSGSSGNTTLVECDETRIIIDAGLGPRELAERLKSVGVDPASLSAIVISHEHGDHAKGAASFSRKWGVRVAATRGTYIAAGLGGTEIAGFDTLAAGVTWNVGALAVRPVAIPHDAAQPIAFVITGGGRRFGHATDLGHVDRRLVDAFQFCDAMLIESNYDPTLLANGPYPWSLKERIFGAHGHLSNADTARYLATGLGDACRHVVLAHLSEKNNHAELALQAAHQALQRRGRGEVSIQVTGREGTDWYDLPAAAVPSDGRQPPSLLIMDRRLGIGLAVALGLALLGIAFLLGRESRPGPAPAPVFVTVPSPAPDVAAATAEPTGFPVASEPPPPIAPAPALAAPSASMAPTATSPASAPASTEDAMSASVARYFSEIETLQSASKGWTGDPNAAAQQILKETVEGQGGGFDALVESNRKLLDRLRGVQAPEPCAEHLQRTIAAVQQASALLDKMRSAIRSQNQTALLSLVAEGQDVERQARAADALAAEIKKRHGL